MGGENVMVKNAVGSWKQWVGQIDKTIGALGELKIENRNWKHENRN